MHMDIYFLLNTLIGNAIQRKIIDCKSFFMFTMRQANSVLLISIILVCNEEIWGIPIKNSDVCQQLTDIKGNDNSVEPYNVENGKSWMTILAECYRRRGRRRRYG